MELVDYVKEIFDARNFALAQSFYATKSNPWCKPFTEDLPSALKKVVNKLERAPLKVSYEYKGSIGTGKLADVFWFGCRHPDLAPSWQQGFYIVYLLSNDGKRLYLSLILGTEVVFTPQQLKEKAKDLKESKERIISKLEGDTAGVDGLKLDEFNFNMISLGGKSNLARAYEMANIFSIMYDSRNGIPTEERLEHDLGKFLAVYKRCLTLFRDKVPNCR